MQEPSTKAASCGQNHVLVSMIMQASEKQLREAFCDLVAALPETVNKALDLLVVEPVVDSGEFDRDTEVRKDDDEEDSYDSDGFIKETDADDGVDDEVPGGSNSQGATSGSKREAKVADEDSIRAGAVMRRCSKCCDGEEEPVIHIPKSCDFDHRGNSIKTSPSATKFNKIDDETTNPIASKRYLAPVSSAAYPTILDTTSWYQSQSLSTTIGHSRMISCSIPQNQEAEAAPAYVATPCSDKPRTLRRKPRLKSLRMALTEKTMGDCARNYGDKEFDGAASFSDGVDNNTPRMNQHNIFEDPECTEGHFGASRESRGGAAGCQKRNHVPDAKWREYNKRAKLA